MKNIKFESLIQQLADETRTDFAASLRPHVTAIAEAVRAMEAILGSG